MLTLERKVTALKTELDPNLLQQKAFRQYAGSKRFCWNWALSSYNKLKEEAKEKNHPIPKFSSAYWEKEIVYLKNLGYPEAEQVDFSWLQNISKSLVQNVMRDLEQAFSNFLENSEHFGYPKFKKKVKNKPSFTLSGASASDSSIKIVKRKVYLPCIGWVRIKRKDAEEMLNMKEYEVLSVTVSLDVDRWFISFSKRERLSVFEKRCQQSELTPATQPILENFEGLDVGLIDIVTTSSGLKVKATQFYRKAEPKLKKLQKNLARKEKGSNNYKKCQEQLAKEHRKVRRQREDFNHKLSSEIVKTNRNLVMETLNISGMMKNHCLAKSIQDAAWYQLTTFLEYKNKNNGFLFFKVDQFFPSSKLCNICDFKNVSMTLSIREWTCPNCGTVHDRDINAAKIFRKKGTVGYTGAC